MRFWKRRPRVTIPPVPEVADRTDELNRLTRKVACQRISSRRTLRRTDEVVRANNHAKHFREALEARP